VIACLRAVPLDQLMTAVNTFPNVFSYTSVRLGWQPSVDGEVIVRDPQLSIQQGLYAKVCPHFSFYFRASPTHGFL
jgi:acetylcholinesterase